MAELRVEMAKKVEEIFQLRVQMESLERIWEVVENSGDVLNKARFFDNDIQTEGQLSATKIIPILLNSARKMETTLVEIRKLVPGS